jgi:hypothetical protein
LPNIQLSSPRAGTSTTFWALGFTDYLWLLCRVISISRSREWYSG